MKKTWVKILVPAVIVAVLAIAAAIIIHAVSNRPNDIQPYDSGITYFYSDLEGGTRFAVNGKRLDNIIGGTVDSFLTCDGSAGIARAGTGLYRVDSEGILKIYPAGVDRALLSLDNNVIVFTTATEVHIYDHRTGELTDIKPEGIVGVASIAISPSGSTVGYSVKNSDGYFYAYAYENGESRKLSNDAYLMALSDGASFWYYIRPENVELFYATPSSEKKLGTNVSSLLEFNRALTEVTFDMNGVTYASVNGSAARTLIDGASVFTTVAECESVQGGQDCQTAVKACTTMFDGIFYAFRSSSSESSARTVYDLWYVDGGRNVTELVKGAYQFNITEDDSSLSCLVDDGLYIMDAKDPGKRECLCTSVYSYCASPNGKKFYCVGYDLGLYYVEAGAAPARIATNVVYSMITRDGKCLYLTDYDKVGKLCLADGANEPAAVAEGVAHLTSEPRAYYYYTDYYEDELGNQVNDIYVSLDGTSFELMTKSVVFNSSEEQ